MEQREEHAGIVLSFVGGILAIMWEWNFKRLRVFFEVVGDTANKNRITIVFGLHYGLVSVQPSFDAITMQFYGENRKESNKKDTF